MTKALFHPRTESALNNYLHRPTHGLVLSGPEGTGKYFTALWLTEQIQANQYTVEALDGKNTIAIEQIRELYRQTQTGSKITIIIKESNTMGREAQNAFLKLLEEPPKNTYFILTTTNEESLLPTIQSRTQNITMHNPPRELLVSYVTKKYPTTDLKEVDNLLLTTQGRTGALMSLLESPELLITHYTAVSEAKQFYAATTYELHKMCIEHGFEKEWLHKLLDLLAIIIQTLLNSSTENPAALKRLNRQAAVIEQTITNIAVISGNPKIHLTRLIEVL